MTGWPLIGVARSARPLEGYSVLRLGIRRPAFVVCGLLLLVTAASCSPGQEAAEPVIEWQQWQAIIDEAQHDQLQFAVAQDVLAGQCMREQGFDYEQNYSNEIISEPPISSEPIKSVEEEFRLWEPNLYGYRSVRFAEESGEPVDPSAVGVPGNRPYEEAWFDAFFGPVDATEQFQADFGVAGVSASKEGCLGEATAMLGGQSAFELSGIASAFTILTSDIENRVQADGALIDASERWSTCMAGQGHRSIDGSVYQSPRSAREEALAHNADSTEASQEEISLAVADKACQIETDYLDVLIEVTAAHQNQTLASPEAESLILQWQEIGSEPRRLIDDVLEEHLVDS